MWFSSDICGRACALQKSSERGNKEYGDKTGIKDKLVRLLRAKSLAELQKDLTILSNWAIKWPIRFNAEKCKVTALGKKLCKIFI